MMPKAFVKVNLLLLLLDTESMLVWCPAHWKNSGLVNLAHTTCAVRLFAWVWPKMPAKFNFLINNGRGLNKTKR